MSKKLIDVEIKNRYNGNIILSGKYESIKDALEKNSGTDLRGCDLSGSNLRYSSLRGCNLRYSDLRYSDLSDSDLRGCNLTGSKLSDSNLRYSDLTGSKLSDSDLRYSDLRGCNLRGCNLDFSCMPLWCGDLEANYDDKQIIQQLYHVLSHVINSNNCSKTLKRQLLTIGNLKVANKFHRIGECDKLKSSAK